MRLTPNEELELKYMKALGYKWIAKDKPLDTWKGAVWVYKNKPERGSTTWGGGDISNYGVNKCMLGEYEFLTWDTEAIRIDDLLNGQKVPLVYPK